MYRITTEFTGPMVAGGGVNYLYFDQGGGTSADAHSAVVAFWNAVKGLITSGTNMTVLGEIDIVDNVTGDIEGQESTDQVIVVGTAAGNPLPPNTQGLIRWRTGVYVGGREIRGRTFVPALTSNSNSAGGVPASTTVSTLTTAAGSLYGDPDSELVVWSKTHGQFATVTSASVWSKFATLRSRRD